MSLDQKFWRKYFRVYDLLNELIPYQELLESITRDLDVKKGDRIFDAGSGTGNLALKIHEKGAVVIGLDASEAGIALHKSKIPDAEVHLGDLTKPFHFADNSFDKICSNNTIYTLPKEIRPQLFKEFHRVLKPSGIIAVSNLAKGFNPIVIYSDHVKKQIARDGIIKASGKLLSLLGPTIKIFYYNHLIKKAHKDGSYDFMSKEDQESLLTEAGFSGVKSELVYSQQGILSMAKK